MSKILVNEIGTWTGTEIALVSGRFLTGTASQFKITGGTAGQALITDGSGGLTFGDAGSSFPTQTGQAGKFLTTDGTDASWGTVTHPDPTMGGDLTGTASNAQIAAGAVGATEIAAGAVGATEIASTIDLSGKTVTLPSASVTSHVTAYDDAALRNDISTLALHSAIADNKAAYNLSNSFIDQFEDLTGIDVLTDCGRTGEYITSIVGGGNDSNTLLLIASNTTNGSTTFTDTSVGGSTHSISRGGSIAHSTAQKKFGTSSIFNNGATDSLYGGADSDFDFGSGDFTIDAWIYPSGNQQYGTILGAMNSGSQSNGWNFGYSNAQNGFDMWKGGDSTWAGNDGPAVATGAWTHLAFVKYGTTANLYVNGTSQKSGTPSTTWDTTATSWFLGRRYENENNYYLTAYVDEVRMSDVARWTADFTPPTVAYTETVANATGNYTSTTETASATVSKMGIVVLYKENAGSTTLNTDLVAQVSANGGTNYSNATLVAGGTFSTGIKIASVSGVSVTAGTAPKYKISFANQAVGSKETQVHGVALLY
jgi:hypothetical protein